MWPGGYGPELTIGPKSGGLAATTNTSSKIASVGAALVKARAILTRHIQ